MNRANHHIYNKTVTLANTEYSQQLSNRPTFVGVKCRPDSNGFVYPFKISFVSGESGTNYLTVPANSQWESRGPIIGQKTIYFQSPQAGIVVEIEEWT